MAIPCDVSSECGGLACIAHECVRPADAQREQQSARIANGVEPIRTLYAGASPSLLASFGGRNIQALGGDVFFGARLRRWLSLEIVYTYDFATNESETASGGGCVTSESFRWQTLGARVWFHVVHSPKFDLSAAPFVGVGFAVDHALSCNGNDVVKGPVAELGAALAIEVRPAPWFGLRVAVETLIDFGVSLEAFRGSFGPVFRF